MALRFIYVLLLIKLSFSVGAQTLTSTGNLNQARMNHRSAQLSTGSILVAGGEDGNINGITTYASCEIYDPSLGIWSMNTSMKQPRTRFTIEKFNSLSFIAIGGRDNDSLGKTSCEIYNSNTNAWTYTSNLNIPRYEHCSVVLPGNAIFVAGGTMDKRVERYDPFTQTWIFAGTLNKVRQHGASMIAFSNGKILITGGTTNNIDESSAELYDPATQTWTLLSSGLSNAKAYHKSVAMANGRILITGGQTSTFTIDPPKTCDFFDPTTNTFTAGPLLSEGRNSCDLIYLYNGNVMVFGIGDPYTPTDTKCLEMYDLINNTWTSAAYNISGAQLYTIDYLPGSNMLIAGGSTFASMVPSDKCYLATQPPMCTTPDLSLTLTGSSVCSGVNGKVTIHGSQNGMRYGVYQGSTLSSSTSFGNGGDLELTVYSSRLSTGNNSFTVHVTPLAGCGTATLNNTVAVAVTQVMPTPVIQANGPLKICSADSLQLSVTTGPYATYLWSNNKTTSTIWVKGGNLTVRIGNAQGCISYPSNALTLTTATSPTKPFAGFNERVQEDYPSYFLTGTFPGNGSWSGLGTNAYSYFDPSQISSGTTVTLTYTIGNEEGCYASNTKTITVFSKAGGAHRLYVNQFATGANNGSSWTDAYTNLQDALSRTDIYVNEIWIAQGTYIPHPTNRDATFMLYKGLSLFGGFNGTETSLSQRDLKHNLTILSGEIGAPGLSDNIKNIINAVNSDGELNGLRMMYGSSGGSSATQEVGLGGAIFATGGKLKVISCWFSKNNFPFFARNDTGYDNSTRLYFYNCVFSGNIANDYYACLNAVNACVANCTFVGNVNPIQSAGILINSIVWYNTTTHNESFCASSVAYNCMLQPIICTSAGNSVFTYGVNKNAAPNFTDADGMDNIYGTLDDDVSLMPRSYAINAGAPDTYVMKPNIAYFNTYYLGDKYSMPVYDFWGQPRMYGNRIDVGAIEYQYDQPILYVNKSAVGLNNGSSWTDAFTDLQSAIAVGVNGSKVWVAKGTYYPTATKGQNSRYISFQPKYNVEIYGGFQGDETDVSQRDIETHLTILSGDIGIPGDSSDNSYQVVYNSSLTKYSGEYYTPVIDTTTVLDGFLIEKGTGDYLQPGNVAYTGILIHNFAAAPKIRNCTFQNTISASGPLIYNISYLSNQKIGPHYVNCTFKNNNILRSPRCVLYNDYGALTTIKDCYFYNNTSSVIQDISHAPDTKYNKVEISNCIFEKNTTSIGSIVSSSSGRFKNNTFLNNRSTMTDNYPVNGIVMLGDSSVLDNCRFTNNVCDGTQDGLVFMDFYGEHLFVNSCTFTTNQSNGKTPLLSLKKNFSISNCIFNENIIQSGGSLISVSPTNGTISGCTFKNHANKDAGVLLQKNGNLHVTGTLFENNIDTLYRYPCIRKLDGNIVLTDNIFYKNTGACLHTESGTTTLSSTKFISNTTAPNSCVKVYDKLIVNNCIFMYGNSHAISNSYSYPSIISNCSFYRLLGSAITMTGTNYTIKNCIISNSANISGFPPIQSYDANGPVVNNCIIETLYPLQGSNNLINVDPNYSSPNGPDQLPETKDDNLQLNCNSIAGNNGSIDTTGLSLPLYDIAGNLRIAGGRIDIGAYENSAPASPTVKNDSICGSGKVVLAVQKDASNTYNWYSSTSSNTVVYTNESNSFTLNPNQIVEYYIAASNTMGCASLRKKVYGRSDPFPDQPIISGTTNVCEGDSIQLFTDQLQVTYLWNSSEQTKSIWVKSSASKTVQTTSVYGCQSSVSNPFLITQLAAPLRPVITKTGSSLEATGNGVSYEWLLNNVVLTEYTTALIDSSRTGNYKVKYANEEGCYSEYSDVFSELGTAMQTPSAFSNSISIFPNPATDHLSITINLPISQSIHLRLLNNQGTTLFTEQTTDHEYVKQWNVSTLPKGMYILQVSTSDQWVNKSFILQ